jgi:L-asparaginase
MKIHKSKASLLIIYTGGTIGMIRDPENGTLRPFKFNTITEELPELKNSEYHLTTYAFDPPIDSSNMNHEVWKKLAVLIYENYSLFDGFIILHGTDTMAYSASALSFMLENLSKPVILTGSQLPLGSLRTDAKENLISSIEIAAAKRGLEALVPEVSIFFENKLFRGNRTTKNNSEDFNAFQSHNYPSLAESGVHLKFNYAAIQPAPAVNQLKVFTELSADVVVLKLFPGISESVVQSIVSIKNIRGIILETFGSGNAPNEKWFTKIIDETLSRGVIILGVTQCREGRVEMGMYETSLELEKAGVVSGYDITTEAAVTKMMYLLGKYTENSDVIIDLNRSLRGEITII